MCILALYLFLEFKNNSLKAFVIYRFFKVFNLTLTMHFHLSSTSGSAWFCCAVILWNSSLWRKKGNLGKAGMNQRVLKRTSFYVIFQVVADRHTEPDYDNLEELCRRLWLYLPPWGGAFSIVTLLYKQGSGGIFLASRFHYPIITCVRPPLPPPPPRPHHFRIRSCVSVKCASRYYFNTYCSYISMYLCIPYLCTLYTELYFILRLLFDNFKYK